MNLNTLFKPQSELDKHIIEEHNLQGQDLLKKKTVALLTELYECTNEARFFKFWSKNQKPKTKEMIGTKVENDDKTYPVWRNPLLEEYVDTIHFALSIANDLGYHKHTYTDPKYHDLNDRVLGLSALIVKLPYAKDKKKYIALIFDHLIKYGYQLGFTEEQVIEAYHNKNKENHNRQDRGY